MTLAEFYNREIQLEEIFFISKVNIWALCQFMPNGVQIQLNETWLIDCHCEILQCSMTPSGHLLYKNKINITVIVQVTNYLRRLCNTNGFN